MLLQQLGWQQQRLWHSRLNSPGFLQQHGEQLQGVQQLLVQQLGCWHGWAQGVEQAGAGQAGAWQAGAGQAWVSTGTLRQRLTHTSTGTHVLTRLQTVQGTHSVTWYGTLQ